MDDRLDALALVAQTNIAADLQRRAAKRAMNHDRKRLPQKFTPTRGVERVNPVRRAMREVERKAEAAKGRPLSGRQKVKLRRAMQKALRHAQRQAGY